MKDFSFKDIDSVEQIFTTLSEVRLRRLLAYREAQEIAKIALHRTIRYEGDAVKEVVKYFSAPEVEPAEPQCNCPSANGLRWQTSPVTWAYSAFRQDLPQTASLIRANWKEIEAVCGIKMRETAQANCNICITNEPLDGRGGTLGVAYQPASGDRMAGCGPMCGNIIIDTDEIWTRDYLKTVLLHEQLHAIGLPHSNDRDSIMYARYLGPRGLDEGTIKELKRRYPDVELPA